jgi:hypothetical protein
MHVYLCLCIYTHISGAQGPHERKVPSRDLLYYWELLLVEVAARKSCSLLQACVTAQQPIPLCVDTYGMCMYMYVYMYMYMHMYMYMYMYITHTHTHTHTGT